MDLVAPLSKTGPGDWLIRPGRQGVQNPEPPDSPTQVSPLQAFPECILCVKFSLVGGRQSRPLRKGNGQRNRQLQASWLKSAEQVRPGCYERACGEGCLVALTPGVPSA